MLVQASSLDGAIAVLDEGMKGTMADYAVTSITETKIVDVFMYKGESVNDDL
jgi:hypothetical protein